MDISILVVPPSRLAEPQLRTYLQARDVFVTASGSSSAPLAVAVDGAGRLREVMFYRDGGGQQIIARLRFDTAGALQPVEWASPKDDEAR